MKKAISLILAVIMMLSVVPMQGFATEPVLERIEIADETPISNYYIEHSGWVDLMDEDITRLDNIDYDLYRYDYNLYFSNGQVINTRENTPYEDLLLCGITYYDVTTFLSRQECQKAVDEAIPTIKVTVRVNMTKVSGEEEVKEFEMERTVTDRIVKSIKLIGDIPAYISDYSFTDSFYGKEFEVEYYNGKKEVLTFNGYLGNEYVYKIYNEEREEVNEVTGEKVFYRDIELYFIDGTYCVASERIDCPFRNIEITDYKFDENVDLQSIEYKLTYKDGRTVKKTVDFEYSSDISDETLIDTVDGYPVRAMLNMRETEYELKLSAGYYRWEITDYDEGESRDICKCICHKNGIMYLIGFFVIVFWRSLSLNRYCKCGHMHW